MSKTKIAWTDETANWIVGCSKISEGCRNCYAATAANSPRLQQFPQYQKVVNGSGNWNGNIEFVPKVLEDLLKGKRRRRVFAPSMSDPFHLGVRDEWLDQFFAVVALTPHITYQVLTKRPDRMLGYFDWCDRRHSETGKPISYCRVDAVEDATAKWHHCWEIEQWPLPNLHLGVTVENQAAANERIPLLLQTPAAKRFLSVEPMLEGIHLNWLEINRNTFGEPEYILDCLGQKYGHPGQWQAEAPAKIDQVIIGGESGKNARPFQIEWAESIIAQCREAGVKVFMKQIGSNAFYQGRPFNTRSRAGTDLTEWPESIRIQESI